MVSYIGARVMRVTRLDACGRPIYGPESYGVSRGFVSISYEPEIQEGEDYTQTNANGDLCVSDQGRDTLKWINVSIEFCQVDADLWRAMNPSWPVVRNARGEVTGFRIGEEISDSEGFALEVWPKVSGQGATCDDDDADLGDPPTGYFLLPYVIPRAPEGWTLENGVATFTLAGRTKSGSPWGRGPYNVTRDINGNPVPLLQPISSGAGERTADHFHADTVPLAPPASFPGLAALEPLTPGAVDGIELAEGQPNRACLTVSGSPGRRVNIDWGEGSTPVASRVGREECRVYTEVGTYTVTISDVDDANKSTTYQVEVTEVPLLPEPVIIPTQTTGEAPLHLRLEVDNHGNGQVTIDWGDGTTPQTLAGNTAEGGPISHPHSYATPGEYTISVAPAQDDRAPATTTITVTTSILSAPTNAAADHGPGAGEIALTWEWERGTGPAATGFEVRSRAADGGAWSAPQTVNDPEARTYTVTGLSESVTYEVGVAAVNATTRSEETTATGQATPDPDHPSNPTGVEAGPGAAPGELDVTWEWAAGNGPEATGFEVRHRVPGGTWSAPQTINDPAARTYTVTGLEEGASYQVGVTALSADSRSVEVTADGDAA